MSEANGGYATKEQILGVRDLKSEDVFVEQWGCTVRVRELKGTERGSFEASVARFNSEGERAGADMSQIRVRLCALTMVDEAGNRLFGDHEIGKLGEKSATALQAVFDVASRLSGMNETAIEDAMGESEAIPQEESSSHSA